MSRLSQDGGDADVRASFEKTMGSDYDNANGRPYTPLELFVMELFRTISPNGGSISALEDARRANAGDNYGDSASPHLRFGVPYERHSYINTPHTTTSFDPRHWHDPQRFDPERYLERADQRSDRRGQMPADRLCPLPLRPHHVSRSATGAKPG